MEEITIQPSVIDFLEELVVILIKKEYFSFRETSEAYVDSLLDFIYNELPHIRHRKSPKPVLKYGKYFVKYSANKRTAWYVFFDKKDNRYLIEHITNNHVATAGFLKNFK